MAKTRDTTRYTLRNGQKIVYIGITNSPERREGEHQQEKNFGQMRKEGPKVSKETALDWEGEALGRYRKGHQGKTPEYNG